MSPTVPFAHLPIAQHDVSYAYGPDSEVRVDVPDGTIEELRSALARAGWDFRLVVGDGGHSPNHGGVLLPDALRWLWSSGPADA